MPSAHPNHAVTTQGLSFTWPDGTTVLSDLDLTIPQGRSGLVGVNGSGKSTLLRLLAGVLAPTSGQVSTPLGRVGYLAQDLTLDTELPVDAFLGVDETRRALARIEAGSTRQNDYDLVGEDWNVEERAAGILGRLGFPEDALDRRLGQMSGGETVQLGLARLLLAQPAVLLLDEPTNNLDSAARERLYEFVESTSTTLLIVSHDRDLLERVERIGELRGGTIRWYGGGYSAYLEQVETEQAAAEQAVTTARADVAKQRSDRVDAERALAQRKKYGAKAHANKREPRVVMNMRKRTAQESAAAYRRLHDDRLDAARARLEEAEARVHEDKEIRVDLTSTKVPRGRVVLETHELVLRNGVGIDLDVRGPDRIALVGPNGSGKTTLLHTIAGRIPPRSGHLSVRVPCALLPQRLDLLDAARSVFDNVAAHAPGAEPNTIRAQLARFLFRGRAADSLVSTLSGGELFRATLASLLLADPAPQLLLLDEPTNNLDFDSYAALVSALSAYRGTLVVASHDSEFLAAMEIDRTIRFGRHLPSG